MRMLKKVSGSIEIANMSELLHQCDENTVAFQHVQCGDVLLLATLQQREFILSQGNFIRLLKL